MESPSKAVLGNSFLIEPEPTDLIETAHRRICTPLPVPDTVERLRDAAALFPQVNCYQPPVIWERAAGYQIWDASGNCWIDFTSTAVATNSGHAHPAVRRALVEHLENDGLLAQFSFASDIRIRLAERLRSLAPADCDKVYFWTVGSEAIEAAFRLAKSWGMRRDERKQHVLTHSGDFHGWTLAAHRISGDSSGKPWSAPGDPTIHHLPFPWTVDGKQDWCGQFEASIAQMRSEGVEADQVAAVFIESMQGWGALPPPVDYLQHLRQWADRHNVLLIFDEIQTGFGRTGSWFAYEQYGVRPDLVCIGKGVTSSLPLAAVLGPAEVLDVLSPAEITTTHAAHPLSCAAALANLDVLRDENLIAAAATKGRVLRAALESLQAEYPRVIRAVTGLGLVQAVHVHDPSSGQPSRELARDWTWECVKQGVMFFQVNRPTLKICPPLVVPEAAITEGVQAMASALRKIV